MLAILQFHFQDGLSTSFLSFSFSVSCSQQIQYEGGCVKACLLSTQVTSILYDVLFELGLQDNLLSVVALLGFGFTFSCSENEGNISLGFNLVGHGYF